MCLTFDRLHYLQADEDRSLTRNKLQYSEKTERDEAQYGAIYLQIQEANKEADHSVDFLCRAVGILCNTRKCDRDTCASH